ncbi:unnamed protein product [Arctia plantaginis]|uniref:Uncharacterized protein n=1 Tax=Arctia plantaginis TaxID=874455 RepID=A0A8S0ZLD6_ARCPL|nr:unnamed protein product [Arctia plantaginis]
MEQSELMVTVVFFLNGDCLNFLSPIFYLLPFIWRTNLPDFVLFLIFSYLLLYVPTNIIISYDSTPNQKKKFKTEKMVDDVYTPQQDDTNYGQTNYRTTF